MSARSIRLLHAPFNLGLRPPAPGRQPGVRKLGEALRRHDLPARLGAIDAGTVVPPPYAAEADSASGFLNGPAIARYATALADALAPHLASPDFVLMLGGDCSILLGPSLTLRERGRYGLAYFDAHDDYSCIKDPARRGTYTAAGLALALAAGRGPESLSNLRQLGPYVREEDVVHFGLSRTEEETADYHIDSFDTSAVTALDMDWLDRHGAAAATERALRLLEHPRLDGFWIHLDADVLDHSVMPAVDCPSPHGLTFEVLTELLAPLLASPRAVGMQLTIYDPDLDPDGGHAARLCDALADAFRRSGRFAAPEVRHAAPA